MNYKKTLNLPKTSFPMKAALVQREPQMQKEWDKADLYGQIRKLRAGARRFVLHDVGTRLLTEPQAHQRLDTPSLLRLRRSEPYLHHGEAKTLEEVLTKFNPRDQHGKTSHLSKEEILALAEFLRYLPPSTAE